MPYSVSDFFCYRRKRKKRFFSIWRTHLRNEEMDLLVTSKSKFDSEVNRNSKKSVLRPTLVYRVCPCQGSKHFCGQLTVRAWNSDFFLGLIRFVIGLFQVLFNICLNLATRSLLVLLLGAYFWNWNCVEAMYDVLRFYWLKTPLEARTFISTGAGPLSRR